MVNEKGPQKEPIKTGDIVRFKSTAPDALFPPFSRDGVYAAGLIHGSSVDLVNPTGRIPLLLPVSLQHLEKVEDADTPQKP